MTKNRIDMHAHYLPPAYYHMLKRRNMKFLDGGIPVPEWTEESHLKVMEDLSVIYSCVSVSSPHLHMGDAGEAVETARACNEYGASLMKKYPDRIGVMASLPLPEIEDSLQEIRYCVEELHVTGFSLMTNSRGVYLGDPMLDPVMEALDAVGALVSLHPTEPSSVPKNICTELPLPFLEFMVDTTRAVTNMILSRIFHRYPHIRFIVPHAGAFLPVLADRLQGVQYSLPKLKDIDVNGSLAGLYYDLAGNAMPKQLGLLQKITSKDHLLYGSDCTYTSPTICLMLANIMDDTLQDDVGKIYLENPQELLLY